MHARLNNVQRVHNQCRYGAGAEAGDGLDDCGMEARMARVGHIRPSLLSSRCKYVEEILRSAHGELEDTKYQRGGGEKE